MKIFYLITKSTVGGVQTHVYQLSRYFIEKGNEVGVMSQPGGWLEREVKKIGVKFYPNNSLTNTLNPFKILKAIKEIKRAIQDFKPDLVSCHSTMAGFLGRWLIKNKIPTIFTAHGWGFTKGTPIWQRILVFFLEKIASFWTEKIICVSEYDRKLALRYGIASLNKIITIHNGVEIIENQKSKIKNQKLKIVFVGRLSKQKDPLLLLRGFNQLASELKRKAEVIIVGNGPKRKKLENFIKKNKLEEKVKLKGYLAREKVFEILKEADIFVLTSNWEGFPQTILEAMSCSLAIVATDIGGVREQVKNGFNGFLIKKGSLRELKEALEKLIKNPILIKEMGKRSRERVEREFSLNKLCQKTQQIYQEIVS